RTNSAAASPSPERTRRISWRKSRSSGMGGLWDEGSQDPCKLSALRLFRQQNGRSRLAQQKNCPVANALLMIRVMGVWRGPGPENERTRPIQRNAFHRSAAILFDELPDFEIILSGRPVILDEFGGEITDRGDQTRRTSLDRHRGVYRQAIYLPIQGA